MPDLTRTQCLEAKRLLEALAEPKGDVIEIACPHLTAQQAAEVQAYLDALAADG